MHFKNRFLTVVASAMGVTFVVQVLAFLRQLLIAAYFGVGRDFGAYVMVNSIAAVVVFTFAGIFDSIAVPNLVRTRERDGKDAAMAVARAVFRLSMLLGGGVSVVFLIAVPALAPLFAAGFSMEERNGLARLAWYFLPWTLVCLPYYAAAARHKMEWRFNRVFAAEIVTVAVSIGVLVLRHNDIRMLPFAFACGYGIGLLQLCVNVGLWRGASSSVRGVIRNIGELYVVNQSASLAVLVDRHMQSYLAAGGIGAVNYATQITSSLSSLLTLREIYTVPLTQRADRAVRLERLLSALLLLAVPFAGLVSLFAPEIVLVLLQRGQFNPAATALTSDALRIGALSLISSSVLAPLARMLQIMDRIHYTHVAYLSWAAALAIFGYVFVLVLGWGVEGVALMQLGGSIVAAVAICCLAGRCGIKVHWRPILGWLAFAGIVAVVAYLAAAAAVLELQNTWFRLTVGGAVYGAVVLTCYYFARARLRGIAFGIA